MASPVIFRTLSYDAPSSVLTFTSFVGEEDLLRATTLDAVASRFGLMFKDSAGSAETYHMSQPVDRIDWFISHNWSTPRSVKFGVLCLRFNMLPALLIAIFLCIGVIIPFQVSGFIPSYLALHQRSKRIDEKFAGCLVCGSIAFLVSLLWWRDLRCWINTKTRFCSCCSRRVFLDKTCIHQTDLHLKRKGIEHLAGFIENSRGMLVVFADTYLVKLWTVYEVASYLALCPRGKLVIVPIFLPPAFALSWVLCTIFNVSGSAVLYIAAGGIGGSLVPIGIACRCLLPTFAVAILLRRLSKEKEHISKQVEDFSLRHAKCFNEDDRAIVQQNVAKLMKAIRLVKKGVSEEDALDAFDKLVRRKVPQFMHRSFAHSGIQYRYVTTMNISLLFHWLDIVARKLRKGAPMSSILSSGFCHWAMVLFWWPLSVEIANKLVKRRLDARCHHEMFIVAMATIAGGSLYFLGVECTLYLDSWSRESTMRMVIHAWFFALLGLLTWCAYGGRRRDEMPETTSTSCTIELCVVQHAVS